jgi:hypothetical protein
MVFLPEAEPDPERPPFILIRQLCQSTDEIEFDCQKSNLSSALHRRVQYLVVVVINIIC